MSERQGKVVGGHRAACRGDVLASSLVASDRNAP